jgi:hypothetical protein
MRPYNFSVGAGDVGEDFITPHHPSRRWLASSEERWWWGFASGEGEHLH